MVHAASQRGLGQHQFQWDQYHCARQTS
jgi:hypothetical protein